MANYFNLRKFAGMRHSRHYKDMWEYKGYKCGYEVEQEEDKYTTYIDIETPEGKMLYPNLSYNDTSRKNINAYIDSIAK